MLLTIVLLTAAALVATQDPQNGDRKALSVVIVNVQETAHGEKEEKINGTSLDSSLSSSMQTTPMTNSTMDMTTMSMMETTPGSMMESSRNSSGRAINFNMAEDGAENNSSEPEKGSLQDLSLDDIDMSSLMTTLPVTSEASISDTNMTEGMCTEGSVTYKVGDMFNRSCEEVCKCEEGAKVECSPRCVQPTFRRGARQLDPMCYEHPAEDPCCAVLVCTHDTAPEPLEGCTFKNETYQRGDVFNDGCEAVCTCGDAGKLACKARCPAMPNNSSDRCVTLTDPTDSCCTVVRCDVTLGDHDASEVGQEDHTSPSLQLLIAEFVNATAVRLGLAGDAPLNVTIEASMDQQVWKLQPSKGLLVLGLEPGHTYYLRANAGGVISNTVEVVLPEENPSNATDMEMGMCIYKGKNYTLNQEFHDGCEAFCVCSETGVECANIDCPTEFGLDLVDSHCLEWDTHPDGFVPVPPRCCPDKVQCKNNGSCEYQGELYSNWAEVPTTITGCEKRCFCQFGNVTCQSVCPPVTATPPADIQCQPHEAILGHLPEDDCCLYWICPPLHHPGPGNDDKKLGHAETGHRQQNMSSTGQILPGPTKFDSNSFPLGNTLQRHPSMPSSEQPFLGPFNPDHLHPSPTPQQNLPDSNKSKPQFQDNGLLVPGPVSPQLTNNSQTENVNVAMHSNKLDHHMNMQGVNNKHKIQVEEHPENDENSNENIGPYKVQPPFLPQHPHSIVDWIHPHLEEHVQEPQTDPPQQIKTEQNSKKAVPVRKPAVPPVSKAPQDQENPDIDVDALLEHLHQQGVLPPHYTVYQHQPPSSKPELEEEILAHLQQQGVLPRPDGKYPPHHPGVDDLYSQGQQPTQHRVPPSQRPKKPDPETERNILVHLQEQGLIPPQHGLPPQGKHPKHPQNDKAPHESEEDILAQFQQGLLPFQQQPQGRPIPGHPQTIPDPYHQHPSGKPLPPHSLPHPFQQRPPAHPQPIPDEELLLHLQQQGLIPPQYTIHPGSPPPPPPHFLIPPGQFKVPHHNQSHAEFGITSLPTGFSQLPHIHSGQQPDEVVIQTLVPLDPHTVRLVFSVPPVLVGLHGRVELRYTSDKQNDDISTWEQQVLAPPKDLIATPQLEFSLGGLQPDTEYRIKITVILRDLHNSPSSSVVAVRTLPAPSTTLPPVIAVQPNLSVAEANSSWITVTWRKFDDFELQLIDGIQLRYKELDDKVYSTTPLIHRAVTSYVLEGLKPSTTYEIGIFFIPFPGQNTELQADSAIQVTTAEVQDLYKFDVRVEVHHIKSTSVEVNWTGVPYPVDKYVNIFRVIYQSDSGKEDFSTFKVAKRNLPASTLIKDLIPGTRYRLWLEVYLTNGKIMKSNVQDFSTRPGSVSSVDSSQQGKLESVPTPVNQAGDYYSPLVAVAILAALAILATLILLLILMRKNSQHKAAISSSRKSQSAYDNPSYKTCEDQPAANGTGTAKPTAAEPS